MLLLGGASADSAVGFAEAAEWLVKLGNVGLPAGILFLIIWLVVHGDLRTTQEVDGWKAVADGKSDENRWLRSRLEEIERELARRTNGG